MSPEEKRKRIDKEKVKSGLTDFLKDMAGAIIRETVIPRIEDTIKDSLDAVFDSIKGLYGRGGRPREGYRYASSGPHVSYNRYSKVGRPLPPSSPVGKPKDISDIIFATQAEADQVLDRVTDYIRRYDSASRADLYDLVGITPRHTDENYGWKSAEEMYVIRKNGGYMLDLPKAEWLGRQ